MIDKEPYGHDMAGKAFCTPEELEFLNKFAEIQDDVVHTTSETLAKKTRKLLLRNLQSYSTITPMCYTIPRIFDIFIRHTLEKEGGNLENTRYWLSLRYPKHLEHEGFLIYNEPYAKANGQSLLNLISKDYDAPNSSRLGLDESMKKFGLKTPNVVGDGYSLPKALVIGKLWSDFNNQSDERIQSQYTSLTRANRAETTRPRDQLKKALDLLDNAGVKDNGGKHDSTHLAQLADYLEDYQIVVWHLPPSANWPVIAEEYNKEAEGLIPLFYSNGHYEFFKPSVPTVKVFFCFKCNKLVKKNHERKCTKICKRCGAVDCKPVEKEELHCEKCNNTFHSRHCLNRHLKKKANQTMPYCDAYEKCPKCFKIYKRRPYSTTGHQCFQNYFCNICMQWTQRKHGCAYAAPTPANRSRQLKLQESWVMVLYALKCTVSSSREYTVKHVPNVLTYKMICNKCMGKFCRNCGSMEEITYNLRPGESGTVLERFVQFLRKDPRLVNAYVIAHNDGRYNHDIVLENMVKSEASNPKFVMDGSTLVSAAIPISKERTLHFRDSTRFLPMSLDQLPAAFNLETDTKGIFPYLYNHPDNYGKVLPTLPPIDYYEPRFKSPKERENLMDWYEKNKDQPFDFDKEIVDYCKNDVQILMEAVVKYIEFCQEKMGGWNPFIQASTFKSFLMFVMKHEHIEDGVVGYIPQNGYGAFNDTVKYLRPRSAMYGGRTQQFQSLVKACSQYSIEHFRFHSLYSFVNFRGTNYPIGVPSRITTDFLPNDVPFSYRGLVFCDILPPSNCALPVLPMRSDGKVMYVLCRSCGQSKRAGECTHTSVLDRYLSGVWSSDEINLALEEGYQILKYHEVWNWPDDKWFTGGFFESFMAPLLKMKHEASGWPRENMTDEEKLAHIDAIAKNDKVNLDNDSISKNLAVQYLATQFLNNTWKHFVQTTSQIETKLFKVSDTASATDFINKPGYTPNLYTEWNDDHLLVSRMSPKIDLETSKYTNITYGVLTTSAARIELYRAMKKVGPENIIYCDTDSIIFRQTRGEDVLGDLRGNGLGQLTDETPSGHVIDEIVARAPKVYSIRMLDQKENEKHVTKIKGITLNCEAANKVNFETMKKKVLEKLDGKRGCSSLGMKRGSNGLDDIDSIIEKKLQKRASDKENFEHTPIMD